MVVGDSHSDLSWALPYLTLTPSVLEMTAHSLPASRTPETPEELSTDSPLGPESWQLNLSDSRTDSGKTPRLGLFWDGGSLSLWLVPHSQGPPG